MKERLYTVATVPFEAARQVEILPADHRSRRLHGHSFLARIRAELPPQWAPFPGAEKIVLLPLRMCRYALALVERASTVNG